MDRAGNRALPLTDDEVRQVFTAVESGVKRQEVIQRLPRNRTTVSRAYNVAAHFHQLDLTSLDGRAVEDIREKAGYGASVKYVEDLFRRWRGWRGVGAERQPGREPAALRQAHVDLVRSAGNRLRGALAGLPPVPSDLIHGGAGDWWDAEAAIAQIASDGQLQTLRRHAAGSDFPQAIQQFFDRLMPYPAAAQNAMKSVEVAIRTRIPHSVSTAAAGLFCQAVDRACVASAEHRGSWDSAQDEFQHLTMMGPHVKETGGVYEVTMGLYVAARLNSFEQSEVAATVLGELASDLWDSSEIRALAEAYFDLLGLRRELVEHLSPVAVDKWAVDGRCVWCPAPG